MCQLLSMFLVIGSYQINSEAVYFEIMNNGVVEQFVVPVEQYNKCYTRISA